MTLSLYILWALLGLLLVPFFDAVIRKTKAFLNGRNWPSILQSYYDYLKLFQKENFISQFTSLFSHLAPVVLLVNSVLFFFLIPLYGAGFSLHIFVILFILWITAFFLALYGMDNATYFGWLGASRELFVLFLVESLLLLSVWFLSHTTWVWDLWSLHDVIRQQYSAPVFLIQMILFAVIMRYILVAENKRFPFDNPTTHLELTMIHEAMLLETTGPTLGMIELASKINLIGFMSLFSYLVLPFDFGIVTIVGLWFLRVAKIVALCVLLWIRETYITKLRIFRYPVVLFSLLTIQIVFIIFHQILLS